MGCVALCFMGSAAFIGKSGYPAREMGYFLELAAQCCRALRNLSVNRKFPFPQSISLTVM